jgi:(2Fe-2S) ferredoxin
LFPLVNPDAETVIGPTERKLKEPRSDKIKKGLRKAGVAEAKRHLFLCLGPDCCDPRAGEKTWEFIKRRIKETGLKAMRTKAQCFRICTGGPWLVVYPDGIWYRGVTPARFERILQEHLLSDRPVKKWIAARNPLRDICENQC